MLQQLGRGDEIESRFALADAAPLTAALARDDKLAQTSSLSCYINAAAGLLGVKSIASFDGQAASLLEGMADHYGGVLPLEGGWTVTGGVLSLLPLFAVLADEKDPERGAAIFHATLVAALSDWVRTVAPVGGTVVGSGACFLNLILARGLRSQLGSQGLQLIESRRLPPNDGGLAFGQAWVAQQYLLG